MYQSSQHLWLVWLKYQAYQGLEVVAPAGHLCTMGNRQRGVNRVVMAARDLDAGIELVSSIEGRGCPVERWIDKHFLTASSRWVGAPS